MNLRLLLQSVKLTLWLLVLFAGAWVGEQISHDPGYLIFTIAGYRIETTAWLALIAIIMSWILVYFSMRLIANLRLDKKLVSWQRNRSKLAADLQLRTGIYQLAKGNFKVAGRLFQKSATKSSFPTIGWLLAAYASHLNGRRDECDRWLVKAESAEGSDLLLTPLLQAKLQLQRNEPEHALATLNRIKQTTKSPIQLELMQQVLTQLQDWKQLDSVLLEIKKLGLKSPVSVNQAEKDLCLEHFAVMDSEALNRKWKTLSASLKKDREIILAYSNRLAQLGLINQAEQCLQKAINQEFDPELLLGYGLLSADSKTQLVTAERWLREKPADANLLVSLGRLSLKNQYWGKAQEYFNLAIDINNHPIAHAELGRFYAAKKEYSKSILHYENCIISGHHLPETPLPEPESHTHG